jgi:hypothetical protein
MPYTTLELEAYLDEQLSPELMAQVEQALRDDVKLMQELVAINNRREAGVHSIGGVWRRHRLSCPTREQLGSYLLGAMSKDQRDYVKFHLETVGCRYCQAGLEDLRSQQQEAAEVVSNRRAKYFQTSAGYLKKE